MVEFKILWAARREHSKLATLDFRKADLGLFQAQEQPNKEKSGKNTRRPAWMNKELLDKLKHKKEAYRR